MRKQTLVVVLAVTLQAADSFPPSAEQKRQMQDKLFALSARVKGLAAKQVDAALLADVDVYRKAAEWILRYPEEFYTKAYAANAIAAPPAAPVADPDDLMALFAESAAKSNVPEALNEAYERVEINDLLNDVRSIKKLLGPNRK